MEDRRIKLRRHIQAARAWLLQADKSLERKNDVQGSLKLMLARAELAQAQSKYRSRLKKILPPLTAMLIVGAVMLNNPSLESEEAQPLPPLNVAIETPTELESAEVPLLVSTLEPTVEPEPIIEVEPTYESTPEPIEYSEPTYYEPLEESTPEYSTAEPTYEEPIEPIEYSEPTYYEPYEEPIEYEPTYEPTPTYEAVPTEDMQQLMLDAGQILRAK